MLHELAPVGYFGASKKRSLDLALRKKGPKFRMIPTQVVTCRISVLPDSVSQLFYFLD
jgi:hypothetical protein